jgi:predicted  nucleic acid-binding Zn-ribbon protein
MAQGDPWTIMDWAKVAITGAGGAILTLGGMILKTAADHRREKADEGLRSRELSERVQKDQTDSDVAHADSMTRRFQALMDGYESRIKDLTNEVSALRDEVRNLRNSLDTQTRMCASCPHFQKAREHDALSAPVSTITP